MAYMNTKKTALFVKSGSTLPVPPLNFYEATAEFVINPNPTVTEIDRISGKLGGKDSYTDTCHATFSQSISHNMRSNDSAATALATIPEYGEMLKTCAFDEQLVTTLILSSVVGLTVGTVLTGDTSSATGTVLYIDTVNAAVVVGSVTGVFTAGGEGLNTAAFTSTSAGVGVRYVNSQTPVRSSMVAMVDGKKFRMTDSVVGDATFTFDIGKVAMLDVALSGFMDESGVPSDATLILSSVVGLTVGTVLTGDTSGASGTVQTITGTTVELINVTGTFTAAGETLNTSSYTATSATQGTPNVTLSTEPCLIVSCGDIITAGGTTVSADKITIAMGADIQELYAMGLKEFNVNDYVIKLTADFYVDSANYADAITKLNAETAEAIIVKLGTNQTGSLINGKSIEFRADLGKASAFTDSVDKSRVKRSFTWLLRGNAANENLMLKVGYFG